MQDRSIARKSICSLQWSFTSPPFSFFLLLPLFLLSTGSTGNCECEWPTWTQANSFTLTFASFSGLSLFPFILCYRVHCQEKQCPRKNEWKCVCERGREKERWFTRLCSTEDASHWNKRSKIVNQPHHSTGVYISFLSFSLVSFSSLRAERHTSFSPLFTVSSVTRQLSSRINKVRVNDLNHSESTSWERERERGSREITFTGSPAWGDLTVDSIIEQVHTGTE